MKKKDSKVSYQSSDKGEHLQEMNMDELNRAVDDFTAKKDSMTADNKTEETLDKNSFEGYIFEKRFKGQKHFMYIHVVILFLIFGYLSYIYTVLHELPIATIFCTVWVALAHLYDFYLCSKSYNMEIKKLLFSKRSLVISVAFLCGSFGIATPGALFTLPVFILYVIEYIGCIEFSNSEVKERTAIVTATMMGIGFVTFSVLHRNQIPLVEFIFVLGIIVFAIYSIVDHLYLFLDHYVGYITILNNEKAELINNNSSLNEKSMKIKEAIDLLGIQKIELSKANEKIQNKNIEIALQNDVLRIISSEKDVEVSALEVVKLLIGSRDIDMAGIYVDSLMYGNHYPMVYARVNGNEKVQNKLTDMANDILLEVHHFNERLIVDENLPEQYKFLSDAGICSLNRIQIITDGGMCGTILLGSKKHNFFNEENCEFYFAIATQIGISVKNANLYSTMEQLATKDGLTGIYNRRHFNKLFSDYVTQAIDEHVSLAVALFDIDKFKNVNDTYGHSFGDTVIVTVAQIAKKIVKQYGGIVGRYGGEEFTIAFYNMNVEGITPIVEEIQQQIKSANLVHNGTEVHINVSIGVTDYPSICSNPADLLNHADWAMYYAKQHGRGRITIDCEQVQRDSQMNV